MIYVALLRGINVGGKNKVDMRLLRSTFERVGLRDVRTYINSGNVIFHADSVDAGSLVGLVEDAIEQDFGFRVRVLVRDADNITAAARALPDGWANDQGAKCDVLFLGEALDSPAILARLTVKPDIDDVRYVPGAVLWRVDRSMVGRSGLLKLVGTDEYRQMTVRNCNTLRKLAELVRPEGPAPRRK